MKICVESPEIVMQGDINISAQIAVVTKAKLDAISVGGNCHCEEEEPLITDFVIVIDGSDSYNNKVTMGGGNIIGSTGGATSEGEAFDQTKRWTAGVIKNLANSDRVDYTTVTVVQFSGIKPLEKTYSPGTAGATGTDGLSHYKIEIPTTAMTSEVTKECLAQATAYDALDGNGQLFLCLQDLAMPNFIDNLTKTKEGKRQTVLIVVSDEEWDVKNLQNAFGDGNATGDSVCAAVHSVYDAVHAVIVRPNKFEDQNEDFIVNKLCGTKRGNYYKVYTDDFERDMNEAGTKIMNKLGYRGKYNTFFPSI